MTEEHWLTCDDPNRMLRFLSGKASARKLRLFACACCRRIWPRITAPDSRRAVEISECYADGGASFEELEAAFQVADRVHSSYPFPIAWEALDAARLAAHPEMRGLAEGTASAAANAGVRMSKDVWKAYARETSLQCGILRDLVGNLFCHFTIYPAALSWQYATVVRLARTAYDDRILPAGTLDNTRLCILADALEEAGCSDEQILTHLRGGGEHYRGCFVLDALLGKS